MCSQYSRLVAQSDILWQSWIFPPWETGLKSRATLLLFLGWLYPFKGSADLFWRLVFLCSEWQDHGSLKCLRNPIPFPRLLHSFEPHSACTPELIFSSSCEFLSFPLAFLTGNTSLCWCLHFPVDQYWVTSDCVGNRCCAKVESVFLFLLWCNFSALCKRNGCNLLNQHLEEFFLERQRPPFYCFSIIVSYLFHVLNQSSRPKLYRPSSVQRGMNRGPCSNWSGHLWNVHCEWIPGTGSWAQSSDLTCRGTHSLRKLPERESWIALEESGRISTGNGIPHLE